MIQQLLNHIDRHKLCKTTDKILLAVSGGIDSMVMLDLFLKAGFSVGVAHCNFQLRGEESDKDEALVREACGNKIPFFVQRFDTATYARNEKLSTQMAARELRYQFFNQLMNEQAYKYVATAHHLNDSFETALLNFVKGTGIDGMTGVPVKTERVIRPLLFATRNTLLDYARANKIQWREDASNESDDYQRNFLRNKVIRMLKEINPNLEETFRNTQERLHGAALIFKDFVNNVVAPSNANGIMEIKKDVLMQSHSPATILWEVIKTFGFNYDQAKEVVSNHQSGRVFISQTHVLTVDRESLIVNEKQEEAIGTVKISEHDQHVSNGPQKLLVREVDKANFTLTTSVTTAQLDSKKIEFPLVWRPWQAGDSFVPLGMRERKKLSDFLIDLKISLPEKKKITVVESRGVIVWVVGFRIHDDYKITEKTDRILVLEQR